MATIINITKRVALEGKGKDGKGKSWRFCPVVRAKNGMLKPNAVRVNGKEETHEEGSYFLDWSELRNGKRVRVRIAAGRTADEARSRAERQEKQLAAKEAAAAAGITLPEEKGKQSLAGAVQAYLEETKDTKKPKTYAGYKNDLTYFLESTHKQFLEDVNRSDLLRFRVFLRDKKKLSPRTEWNKFSTVMTFLGAHRIDIEVKKNDWPSFVEEEPEIYEPEELNQFFAACDEKEKLYFEFFLMTGMREQEVMYCQWKNINFKTNTVTVRANPEYNWTPKAYREREITVPKRLMNSLFEWKKQAKTGCSLLFPTAGCKPKFDFLDVCKAVAKRADMNPETAVYLHKFRATFGTRALRHSDLRTVQSLMGHKDIQSTMRYLKPNRGVEVSKQVEDMWNEPTDSTVAASL